MNQVMSFIDQSGAMIMWFGLGSGVLILFMGLVSFARGQDPVSRRLSETDSQGPRQARHQLVLPKARTPTGFLKAVVPTNAQEFSAIRRQLRHAGFDSANSVAIYFLVRSLFGLLLPGAIAAFAIARPHLDLPYSVDSAIPDFSHQGYLFLILAFVVIGFYGPAFYVRKKTEKRKLQIVEGFPNTLDLMQISVGAGLGFDAAMARVAQEIRRSSPAIAEEFEAAQREISSGRERDSALSDMADRMAVPEVSSFVSVVQQSMHFGTSVSEALTTYADDMRLQRELKAQEKANQLPVQMSVILVMFMLPALLALVFAPIVIRYVRILAPAMTPQ